MQLRAEGKRERERERERERNDARVPMLERHDGLEEASISAALHAVNRRASKTPVDEGVLAGRFLRTAPAGVASNVLG
jgi:hypothetical protein